MELFKLSEDMAEEFTDTAWRGSNDHSTPSFAALRQLLAQPADFDLLSRWHDALAARVEQAALQMQVAVAQLPPVLAERLAARLTAMGGVLGEMEDVLFFVSGYIETRRTDLLDSARAQLDTMSAAAIRALQLLGAR